jgi:hypothetical protein
MSTFAPCLARLIPWLARAFERHHRISRQLVAGIQSSNSQPPTMDYSAHDPDHPGGRDPWASSPQANRTSFGQPPTNDIPSSPLPPQASPYHEGGEQYGYMGDQDAQSRPGTAPENGDHLQQPQMPSQDAPRSPNAQQGQQQPQRYHGNRPQRQQQHYKLQAKVTGLERNSKKDPILRFDVYVRLHNINTTSLELRDVVDIEAWCRVDLCFSDVSVGLHSCPNPLNIVHTLSAFSSCTDLSPDEPPQVPNHPIPRCPTSTLRVRKARRASYLSMPRSYCACSTTGDYFRRRRHRRRRGTLEDVYTTVAEHCVQQ